MQYSFTVLTMTNQPLNERQRHGNGDSVCFLVKHASNDIVTT